MAKCIYCGKKGPLLRTDKYGRCDACRRAAKREEAEINRAMTLYHKLDEANSLPLSARIIRYENILSKNWNALAATSYAYHLVSYYRQSEDYDKAWELLNRIQLMAMQTYSETGDRAGYDHQLQKIRWAQYELCALENRYLEAVQYVSEYYVIAPREASDFNFDAFLRRARPLGRKGGMTTDQVKVIGEMIRHSCGEPGAVDGFSHWLRGYLADIQAALSPTLRVK